MTLIKTGGSIVNIAGGLAGNSFSRDKTGLHMNAQPRYIYRKKSRQSAIRTAFLTAANFWRNKVSELQRSKWNLYAARHPKRNKVGESIILSAYSSYLTINILRALNGLEPTADPPID